MDARIVVHHGLFTMEPLSDDAECWTREHLPKESEKFNGCFHFKARFMPILLGAMKKEGLAVYVTM